ncbi:MAG: pitrilysin family protein [Acidobacteriota bacterium]
MKRLLFCALAALALTPTVAAGGILPFDPTIETLDNGLQVILIPMPADGLVSYWTVVRTGARDEVEEGRTGFAHFFEHMMFRGTEKYPAEVFNEKITLIGANSNAYTSTDLTAYYATFAAKDLELVIDLESDRFQNLLFSEEVFKTEAGAVYGEYRKNRASPFFTIYEALRGAAFSEHTYGHTPMGYVEDIKKMPEAFDYSKTFFQRFYRPENCIVMIAGDFDVVKTLDLIKRYYGPWQSGYQAPAVPPEPEQTEEIRIDVPYPGSTLPMMWMAYKAPAYDPADPVQVASFVLAELGFGQTSDLYRQLVLEEQLVVSLSASASSSRDPGLFDIITRVKDPAKLGDVEAAIDGAIAQFQSTPPSAEDVAKVRSRLKYSFLMGLDTPGNVAGGFASLLGVTGDLGSIDTFYATLAEVTPEHVQQAAEQYLQESRRTVATLQGDR